jgi:hypothetical protein
LAAARGLAGIADGYSQLAGRLQRVGKTPAIRTVVVRKEARSMAVDPEFRVFAVPRERRVLVAAA